MRSPRLVASLAAALLTCASAFAAPAAPTSATPASAWPEITRENKPWTRWWWPGSAVDRASLTYQLEQFASAGLGGVEITPIYGAKGAEDRYIDFLSQRWMQMLEHTGTEAQRLGLGVDMATGTGWPFGGPWIDEGNALKKVALIEGTLTGVPTGMMVKRAAPGGEGLVVDPYSPDALQRYLARFDRAFAGFPRPLIRSQFHDSFEYFSASWSPLLPAVFKEMHGYDIQEHAAELLGQKPADPDTLGRLKGDYRATLARMHLDFLHAWVVWSHQNGFLVRNQSHGAPGNLLDLYANADIAETEVFGSTPFPIPGLRRAPEDVRHDQDLPETLVIRMASSASHVAGHPLTSSETCTWLRDHWKVSLAFAKPEIDRLFADGINHIVFHGTVFSPRDAAWPGWLFYASTQFNPNNPWWDDFSALTRYVARVQSVLQRGTPDNEVLLYWPIADVFENPKGLMMQLGVHNVSWLTEHPVGRTARALLAQGYSFDYISDAQLQQTHVEAGALVTPGARYRVLLVPAARRMPVETLRQILELGRQGAKIIFQAVPEDVPGLGRLAQRRAEFQKLQAALREAAAAPGTNLQLAPASALAALEQFGVAREPVAQHGISVIRRANGTGYDYFFANLTGQALDGWMPLGRRAESVVILDPLNGHAGRAALRQHAGHTEIYLQLVPGESLLARSGSVAASPALAAWPYRQTAGAAVPLAGEWQLEFIKGGPALPATVKTTTLKPWTELAGTDAERFAGTARYRLEFEAPTASAEDWDLALGDVRESARVRLNGQPVGTAWSLPFRLRVGHLLKPGRNVLEIEVTNLAANRIRDLDRRGVDWKIMREINFVNINYQPFDASNWPVTPSGLLGPVSLIPLRPAKP
ncbi:glycosyl hydrolase [Opitutus sp. ER46]|uniref:glycosyl hydrolase n=1 Tax=Opitutus sp. ER46 TaxID=2161864 RepID=UPI0013047ED3|nr:glycosyl hydrolase [Opitutus sp. ER46]